MCVCVCACACVGVAARYAGALLDVYQRYRGLVAGPLENDVEFLLDIDRVYHEVVNENAVTQVCAFFLRWDLPR